MKSVGLTGGIATGKSLAADAFRRLGAAVVSADTIARKVVEPGQKGLPLIVDAFGSEILLNDGRLDRRKLGALVFADSAKRSLLNRLLHPLILQRLRTEMTQAGRDVVIAEVPLLFECGYRNDFETVVVVYADPRLQMQRLMKRDGISVQEAGQRIAAQMDIEQKLTLADHVIRNTGSPAELERQVAEVYGKLSVCPDSFQQTT